jgi:hypothetical protein
MKKRLIWSLALTAAGVFSTIPTAKATPTISLSDFTETLIAPGVYDWSIDWTISGFLTSTLVTVTANGLPGLCSPIIGTSGDCSGVSLASLVSGTVSATNGFQSATANFSGSATSMPEPSMAFYITLGFGLLGIAVNRNRFTRRFRSDTPST